MTVTEVLAWARTLSPDLRADHLRRLLAKEVGKSQDYLFSHPDFSISTENFEKFQKNVKRLVDGEPLSRILGEREFWSMSFTLNEDTLDPRPDSETLVEAVLKYFPNKGAPLKILDLGTGTGCLLIALLSEYPHAQGTGVDVSDHALKAAHSNAIRLLEGDRVTFLKSNWFENVSHTYDVIISNPPYIPLDDYKSLEANVRDYDPMRALVAGQDGLDCYRTIISKAASFLNPGGKLFLEIGIHQRKPVGELLLQHHFSLDEVCQDLSGIERTLVSSYDG